MIKSVDHLKKVDLLETQQIGRVVDNKDPRMLQRVRVYVRGVYEDPDTSKLPWVFPKSDAGLGGKPDSSNFQVPEIGSEVLVFWPNKDIYHPFYEGRRLNELSAPKEPFDDCYPHSYGQIDSTLQWWKVNKEQKSTEYFSKELGKLMYWDGAGNLHLNIPANLILHVGGELQIGVGASTTLSSGVNNIFSCGNVCYVSATNGFSTIGGGGGCRASFNGPLYIHSSGEISMDGSVIHQNSGHYPGNYPTPSEMESLQTALANIQEKIQQLAQVAENIKARVDANKEKIGK